MHPKLVCDFSFFWQYISPHCSNHLARFPTRPSSGPQCPSQIMKWAVCARLWKPKRRPAARTWMRGGKEENLGGLQRCIVGHLRNPCAPVWSPDSSGVTVIKTQGKSKGCLQPGGGINTEHRPRKGKKSLIFLIYLFFFLCSGTRVTFEPNLLASKRALKQLDNI